MTKHLGKCKNCPPHSERISLMSKRVFVTYKANGMTVIEECDLLEEEELENVYLVNDGQIVADMAMFCKMGVVLFEDSEGIFSLSPDVIVKIDVL
jgi:hypothetical protein